MKASPLGLALLRAPASARRRAVLVASLAVLLTLIAAQLVIAPRTRSATNRTFVAEADAITSAGAPNTNFGGTTKLETDGLPYRARSYIRFNLRDLSNVEHASLRLYATSDNDLGVAVRAVESDRWDEATIDHDHRPRLREVVAHSQATTAGEWTEIDVTATVKQARAAGAKDVLTVALTRSPFAGLDTTPLGVDPSKTDFASRETGSKAPQLVVLTTDVAPSNTTIAPTTTGAPATTAAPTTTAAPPTTVRTTTTVAPSGCTGSPLTSQSQVKPNTSYCGGVAHERISLASGDTWTNGEVTGASSGSFDGVVVCNDNCTLININVHDNPRGWAGLQSNGDNVRVLGGRFVNNGALGIGSGNSNGLVIDGVEVARNGFGSQTSCGNEGGGIKLVSYNTKVKNSYIHDNNCPGLWFDINSRQVEIANNRVINNAHEGIFYEISQDVSIHNNQVEGNGFGGNGCGSIYADGGIQVMASFNVEIYANSLKNNCNGIAGIQQDRPDSTPPSHLLDHVRVHDNTIAGPGDSGTASDNGANLATRDIVFSNNTMSAGQTFCGMDC